MDVQYISRKTETIPHATKVLMMHTRAMLGVGPSRNATATAITKEAIKASSRSQQAILKSFLLLIIFKSASTLLSMSLTRSDIVSIIKANPGITTRGIIEAAGIDLYSCEYETYRKKIQSLVKQGEVVKIPGFSFRETRYYPRK